MAAIRIQCSGFSGQAPTGEPLGIGRVTEAPRLDKFAISAKLESAFITGIVPPHHPGIPPGFFMGGRHRSPEVNPLFHQDACAHD